MATATTRTTTKSRKGNAAKNGVELSSELAAMKEDVVRLSSHVSSLLDAAKGAGASKASEARETVESEVERVIGELGKRSKKAVAAAESEVTAKPLASIAAAFGVGYICARLFSRSS